MGLIEHPERISAYRSHRSHKSAVIAFIVTFIAIVLLGLSARAETRVINNFVTVDDTKTEYVENPYQTIPITDAEFEELRWIIALESKANNFQDKKAVCEVIFNRVLSQNDWGNTVHEVVSKKHQFSTYKYIGSKKAWAVPGEMEDDAISEVLRLGPSVLPSMKYVYFDCKGGVNGRKHIKIGNTYGAEK